MQWLAKSPRWAALGTFPGEPRTRAAVGCTLPVQHRPAIIEAPQTARWAGGSRVAHIFIAGLLWIVFFTILYFVMRAAVREGTLAAWRVRKRIEKDAAAEEAVGWDPHPGRKGHR